MTCNDCIEWEYFTGYGYGCFCRKRTIPIDDAEKECEDFSPIRPYKEANNEH